MFISPREVEPASAFETPGLGSSEEGANPDPNLKLVTSSIVPAAALQTNVRLKLIQTLSFTNTIATSVTLGHSRPVTDGCLLPQSLSAMRYALQEKDLPLSASLTLPRELAHKSWSPAQ
jgi:hypothetical protein